MLLAPSYKRDLSEINFEKLGHLFREHTSDSVEELEQYINFIHSYISNLKKEERSLFISSLSSLKNSARKSYSKVF